MHAEAVRGRWLQWFAGGAPPSPAGRALLWAAGAAVFLFPFSLVFVAGGLLSPGYGWTATVTIVLHAVIIGLSELRSVPPGIVARTAVVIGVLFFAVEWVGVNSSIPFGRYTYTGVLAPLAAGVPVAIAAAWYCTLMSTWRIASWLAGSGPASRLKTALLAGVLTLALDLALEPFAAMVNGYWLWEGGTVPLQNYLSWFLFSTLGVWMLARGTPADADRRLLHLPAALLVYLLQIVLFAVTGLVSGRPGEPIAALLLAGGVLAVGGRMAGRRSGDGSAGR